MLFRSAQLAREASKFVPDNHRKKGNRFVIGRHLVAAYCRGENEPNPTNLGYIAKALGVQPEELLPPVRRPPSAQIAQAITSLDGTTRLILDVEVEASAAMEILALIRAGVGPTR